MIWNQHWILAFAVEVRKKGETLNSSQFFASDWFILELMTLGGYQQALRLQAGMPCWILEAMVYKKDKIRRVSAVRRDCPGLAKR
jgi:hypothetical protein